jgi:hypothetical protein
VFFIQETAVELKSLFSGGGCKIDRLIFQVVGLNNARKTVWFRTVLGVGYQIGLVGGQEDGLQSLADPWD